MVWFFQSCTETFTPIFSLAITYSCAHYVPSHGNPADGRAFVDFHCMQSKETWDYRSLLICMSLDTNLKRDRSGRIHLHQYNQPILVYQEVDAIPKLNFKVYLPLPQLGYFYMIHTGLHPRSHGWALLRFVSVDRLCAYSVVFAVEWLLRPWKSAQISASAYIRMGEARWPDFPLRHFLLLLQMHTELTLQLLSDILKAAGYLINVVPSTSV